MFQVFLRTFLELLGLINLSVTRLYDARTSRRAEKRLPGPILRHPNLRPSVRIFVNMQYPQQGLQ